MKRLTSFIAGALLASLVPDRFALADQTSSFELPSGVHIVIVEAPYQLNRNSSCIVGTSVPKTYVKSITARYHRQSWVLDTSCMFDAWGDRPLEVKGVVRYFGGKCDDQGNCALRGLFSDGAESFVAEWCIFQGNVRRSVFTSSDDVVHLFMKNIDPPTYDE